MEKLSRRAAREIFLILLISILIFIPTSHLTFLNLETPPET